MVPTLIIICVVSFIIIQLPPGNYLSAYIMSLKKQGAVVDQSIIAALEKRYALDRPIYVQFFAWVGRMAQGDFGQSFEWGKPVKELIWGRMGLTLVVVLFSIAFAYVVAIPIGIYSAIRQYSFGDYLATIIGFLGLATPNFLLALVLMFLFYRFFGVSISGLFSSEMIHAPWSIAKFFDLLKHIWIPMVVIGTADTCGLIRITRGMLLDELRKQYVVTARSKGVSEKKLLFKYPVRLAINPLVSTLGWKLPDYISGTVITAVVLSLPTIGPIFLRSLLNQDMYLAGTIVLLIATLTVIGTLISDILLAWLDPRIRYEAKAK